MATTQSVVSSGMPTMCSFKRAPPPQMLHSRSCASLPSDQRPRFPRYLCGHVPSEDADEAGFFRQALHVSACSTRMFNPKIASTSPHLSPVLFEGAVWVRHHCRKAAPCIRAFPLHFARRSFNETYSARKKKVMSRPPEWLAS